LIGYDRTRTCPDPPNCSYQATDLHSIADVNWALEKQDQSGNKVIHNILKAKAETNAKGA